MTPAAEYDRFAEETRAAVAEQERRVAVEQGQARRLLEGHGSEGSDVRASEGNLKG
jgi:hypothetical protein